VQHPILIEAAIAEIGFAIRAEYELAGALRSSGVNPFGDETLQVPGALTWIDDMNGLVTASEAILNKGKQYAIFFFLAMKECANVTGLGELGTRKRNGSRGLHDPP
jgi:hypothetical protein